MPYPDTPGRRIVPCLPRDESGRVSTIDSVSEHGHLRRSLRASPATTLFMCVFTSQAGVLVLSPILVDVARDLDVSTAVAGQLRVVAAPVAAIVAVIVARAGARLPYRLLLAAGAGL